MTTVERTDVEATLARYRVLTATAMGELLGAHRDAPYLGELLADYPARAGKALRPAIVLATCQAFGGAVEDALGPAVAIELLHNAFLIHDDIEDESARRRGRPTLHRLHGVALALNTGDALAVLSLRPLRDGGPGSARIQEAVFDEYLAMAQHTIAGQAKELGWRRDNVVDLAPADYLDLVAGKTCWYTTIYPLRVGALIGGRGSAPLDELSRFGFYLGAAFQIRDDLLNLVGDGDEYGKDILDDIREGKRTLMLIHLLGAAGPAERDVVVRFLRRPPEQRTAADVRRIAELMEEHGSIDFAIDYGHGVAAAAHAALPAAFAGVPDSVHLDFIRALVPYMLERTR